MKLMNRDNIKGAIVDSDLIKNKNDAIVVHESNQIYGVIQVSPFKRGKNYTQGKHNPGIVKRGREVDARKAE